MLCIHTPQSSLRVFTIICLHWLALPACTCFAQLSYVRQLRVDDGLPQGLIRGMVQDRQGFIWLCSDGLSRYDGRNFLNYKHLVGDTATIADNDIRDLQIDTRDNLWITYATNEVDLMAAATGRLRHISAEPAFHWLKSWSPGGIPFTVRQTGGQYFAATGNGLVTFDLTTGRHQPIDLPAGEYLTALGKVIAGRTTLATTRGIYQLQHNRLQLLYRFASFPDTIYPKWNKLLRQGKSIGEIIVDRSGSWIIPMMGGIYRYDPRYRTATYTGNPAADRIPYSMATTTDGQVYFAMQVGIYRISGHQPPELVYRNNTSEPRYGIVLADRSGMLWADAAVHGVSLFQVRSGNFHSSPYRISFAKDILQPWVPAPPGITTYRSYGMRLAKDTGNRIWLLNQIDQLQNNRIQQEYTQFYRLQQPGATTIRQLNLSGVKPMNFTFDAFNRCWTVLQDTAVRILAKADLQTGAAVPFASLPGGWQDNSFLTSIGRYIGYVAEDALRLYDTATAACRVFSKEQLGVSGFLLMALPDRQHSNLLWIATKGSGIVKLDLATGTTTPFRESEGLPNNTVYYMARDKSGWFWCSSNNGLFRFNPANGSTIAFTVKDGLQGNEFNRYHFVEIPDGHFCFGGTEGYTWFHPDSIYLDNYQTPVALTGLRVNNVPLQQLGPQWKDSLPSHLHHLQLPFDQNQLTFSFAGLQYNAPEKLQYRYQLQGIDKDWVNAGYNTSANYAAIPPGHYTLLVNAANTSGFWSRHITRLYITITPPWWRTWWMYGVYAALTIAAIWGFFRIRLRRLQLAQQVMLKQKEAEQAQILEETKSRFFANITHELRTPLTLILSPVEKQLQEAPATYAPQLLKGIQQNAQTLLRLINQLLDISKLEGGRMPLTLHRGQVVPFIRNLLRPFYRQATARHIHFFFPESEEQQEPEHLFDSDKLEKILYNLLSNAFKFTPDGGQIRLDISGQPEAGKEAADSGKTVFRIRVSDTGIGIGPEHLPHIFDRFYQVNTSTTRRYEGSGIGLSLVKELVALMEGTVQAESSMGSGSVFTLTLPLSRATGTEEAMLLTLPETAEPIAVPPAKTDLQPNDSKPLLLVVEDNEQLRWFIRDCLSAHYRVLTAINGEAGLQTALVELPVLIISDVMMPAMDGYEFCQKVKSTPLTSHIGFILLTAKTADESRVNGLRLGADHYIGKPFMVDELLLTVNNLLQRQQKLRAYHHQQWQQPTEALPAIRQAEDAFLQSVYLVIEDNLDNAQLDVELLAGALSVSRRTLNRKLAAVADTSANELIRNYRLKKAAALLLQGEMVSNAAYATGFSTPSYFSQCFKELYGTTPMQYAENGG